MSAPIVIRGVLGWGNPTSGAMNHQLDAYGPLGRWHNEGRTQGQRLPDALVDAGAHEGDQLIVVAVDRFVDADAVATAVQAAVSDAPTDVFIQWKGTEACLDLHCECGVHGHYDGFFAHLLQCSACGAQYEMPATVAPRRVTADAPASYPWTPIIVPVSGLEAP